MPREPEMADCSITFMSSAASSREGGWAKDVCENRTVRSTENQDNLRMFVKIWKVSK